MGGLHTGEGRASTAAEPHQPVAPSPSPVPQGPSRGRKLAGLLAVLMVIGAGFALRLYRLEDESLWFDEGVSVVHLDEPGVLRFLMAERRDDPPMLPLYFVLEYGWARLVGDSLPALRLLGILWWAGGALCLYRLGRELFGFLAGFTAVLMYSLSTLHVYYSQEIRMYALVVPLATASVLTLILAVRRCGAWWYLHLLINALLLWTHMFAGFLMAAEGLWLLLAYPRRWKEWLGWGAAHAPFVASVAAWFATTDFATLDRMAAWIPMPAWHWIPLTLCWADTWMPKTLPILRIGLVTLALSLGVVFGTAAIRRDRDLAAKGLLLVLWLVVPTVSVVVISHLYSPVAVSRYILHASLAFYLLLGAAISLVPPRWLRALALVALASVLAAQAGRERPFRMQWNKAADIIAPRAAAGDLVVVSPYFETDVMRWYAPVPPDSVLALERAAPAVRRTLAQGSAVWFAGSPKEMEGKSHPGNAIDLSGAVQDGSWLGSGEFPVHVLRFVPKKD